MRALRTLDWGSIITLVLLIVGAAVAFVVVREKQVNMIDDITDLRAKDREHSGAIEAIRSDRALETKINDLTLEVRLLRQEVGQMNRKKR
jgi:hypothetical protein